MNWDDNQEEIRKMLARAEALVGEITYEPDPEVRADTSLHVLRDITDVLAKTEYMTRWLREYDKNTITPLNEDGTFKVLSYDQVVEMYKSLREEYMLLEKQIRGD